MGDLSRILSYISSIPVNSSTFWPIVGKLIDLHSLRIPVAPGGKIHEAVRGDLNVCLKAIFYQRLINSKNRED